MQPQLLRIPQVLQQTGMKRSTLYALMRDAGFPSPIKLNDSGRAVAWIQTEIDSWIASRITATRGGKAGAA